MMSKCIISALIGLTLTNYACASRQSIQSNLIKTYAGETPLHSPHRPVYNQLTVKPVQQGRVRFEDDFKGREFPDAEKTDSQTFLVDITYNDDDDDENTDQDKNSEDEDEKSDRDTENKIKFEDTDEEEHDNDDDEQFNDEADSNDSEDPDDSNDDTTDSASNGNNKRVANRNSNKKRIVRKNIKSTRQRRLQAVPENPSPMATNSLYPGIGYYGYPGTGYLGSYQGAGDPKSGYPSYPTPGPATSYAYPGYPSPYMAYPMPTPTYPGYPQYPGSTYPTVSSGYGLYPATGQILGDTRLPVSPAAYPSPVKGDSSTLYPSQKYPGTPMPLTPQNVPGKPSAYPEYPGSYYQGYGLLQGYPGDPNAPYPAQGQVPYRPGPSAYQPGYQGHQSGRPSRRPKSLTQRAVSAVAEALTSIALYDDYQCVPRILCEVAGGSIASSPTLIKATTGLQPLLSVLQASAGIGTSPLLIFGRAAVLGVTSKGNPSACSGAYPQCPNDPEKLINYLNNHNGGFFRFFGQPELSQEPHNLEQFYGFLSGQFGLQQPQQQNNGLPNQYGLQPQNPYTPNTYQNYRTFKDENKEIESRIQNKPGANTLDDDVGSIDAEEQSSKWSFPDEGNTKVRDNVHRKPERTIRGSKTLKFPDERPKDGRLEIDDQRDYVRTDKSVFFPGESNSGSSLKYETSAEVIPDDYVFDYNHNIYVKPPTEIHSDETTLYVVRGNGDPNHPEIVKVRPGQGV